MSAIRWCRTNSESSRNQASGGRRTSGRVRGGHRRQESCSAPSASTRRGPISPHPGFRSIASTIAGRAFSVSSASLSRNMISSARALSIPRPRAATPMFSSTSTISTAGSCCRTQAVVPSVEALSTRTTCTGIAAWSRIEARQPFRSSSSEWAITTIVTSGEAGVRSEFTASTYGSRRSMKAGLVSHVMPVWDPHPDWLRQAVETALGQRNCEVELIAVDDGCPEPISDLLRDFDDPRLRIIRAEHGGASRARNRGISEARGEYLRFIDADDAIGPDSTALLLDLIDGRDDLIAYGATLFCDEQLNGLWTMTSKVQGDAVEACLLGHFTTRPHAFLFPRPVVDAAGKWSGRLEVSDDWDFILRALEHAEVRGTHEIVTFY